MSMLNSPIWYNSLMRYPNNLYFPACKDKGIHTVLDLVDEHGKFMTFESLKLNYNINGTFLDYNRVINNIPTRWRDCINENKDKASLIRHQTNCNISFIYHLLLNKKKVEETFMRSY